MCRYKSNCFLHGILLLGLCFGWGCNRVVPSENDKEVRALVSTVNVRLQDMSNEIEINGVTSFQNKEEIRSPITGKISQLKFRAGDEIIKGDVFCNILSKEQVALSDIYQSDTTLTKFGKSLPVKSNVTGVVGAIRALNEDYINEGDILTTIYDIHSGVIQGFVPYEYLKFIHSGMSCDVILPNGEPLKANVTAILPSVDAASQMQTILIKVYSTNLPENLNVRIRVVDKIKRKALTVPNVAIQNDEMQKNFWVFTIKNGRAIKRPVELGISNDSITEIFSAHLNMNDTIISDGAYLLSDSTRINRRN